jgi:RNA polymerase sigma-70 factor (ECF subfamily)
LTTVDLHFVDRKRTHAMAADFGCTLGTENRDLTADLTALIPHMRAFAQSLCHDRVQADDLAQSALASAWAHRNAYAPGTNLRAWVFRILRNQYYSDHRRAWRVAPLDQGLAERTLVAVSAPTAALELDDVRRAMRELTDEQREALTLVGVAGLSCGAAAAICGCAEGTIKSRVSRARRRLQTILSRNILLDRSRVALGAMASMVAEAEQLQARRTESSSAVHPAPSSANAARLYQQEPGR